LIINVGAPELTTLIAKRYWILISWASPKAEVDGWRLGETFGCEMVKLATAEIDRHRKLSCMEVVFRLTNGCVCVVITDRVRGSDIRWLYAERIHVGRGSEEGTKAEFELKVNFGK
jgi:hypothetical protein